MTESKLLIDEAALKKILERLTDELIEKVGKADDLAVIGIRTRGVHLAQRIKHTLEDHFKTEIPFGMLDITLYRDDLSQLASQPLVKPTELPFDVSKKRIILVDDVIYTGRTIRAALDQLIDFGRPRLVRLLVLINRGWREYPIQPDFVGKNIETSINQIVQVRLEELDGEDAVLLLL